MTSWRQSTVAPCGSHHVLAGRPLYAARFDEVLKFHEPGLAPVRLGGEAWHIDVVGAPAYRQRFRQTFGFYNHRAAVEARDGWCHIRPEGSFVSSTRFAWCGNYQEARCTVRDADGLFLHLDLEGSPVGTERHLYAGDFRDGLAVVRGRSDGLCTHVDRSGKETHRIRFLDLDVFVLCDDLAALLGHLDDSRTALVAPRVRSANGTGVLARYERVRSPLDRGPDEGLVRPGSRVPWVPSAVLVCRTAALRAVGGFDRSLWAGEDVDLAWRLGDAGWRCRYAPEIECDHEPRGDLTAFIAQRFRDGRSTSPLSRRHSVRLAPVSMSWFEAGWWLIAATWTPLVLLAGLATTTVRLARRLDERGVPRQSCRLAVASLARSARHLARAVARPWLPLLLVLALGSRRARRIVAAAVLIPPLIDWWRTTPSLDPVRFTAISVIDDVSHATGIAAGATIDRNARPVLPHLRARPTSRRVTPTSPTTVPDAHRYGEQT